MGRTLNSLDRERRTMKNIALLSLLTLAILQPLAEAQRGLLGRLALRCRGCSGLPGREAGVWSVGKDYDSASAIFGKGLSAGYCSFTVGDDTLRTSYKFTKIGKTTVKLYL